jgi:GT2 family glycosyltransferase
MSSQVTAVVVCHDTGDYLTQTLQALSQQTRPADRVILVNTSGSPLTYTGDFAETIQLDSKTKLPAALASVTENLISSDSHWLWILHDDSAPEPECLATLLATLETTALVGAIAPKQVDPENPRIIRQLGLTLTPLGEPLSLVSGELDQSQHETMSDVMAVSTAGLLVRTDTYEQLGGLSPKAPPLAADYDLALRIRLAGLRVMVAPAARIRHAQLSLEGKRSRGWLGGSPKTAVRKSAVHLRLTF